MLDLAQRDGTVLQAGVLFVRWVKALSPGLVLGLVALTENALWGTAGLGFRYFALTVVPVGAAVCLRYRAPVLCAFVVAVVIFAQSLGTTASRPTTPILLSYLAALTLVAYHVGYTGVVRRVSWRLPLLLTGVTLAGYAVIAAVAATPEAWVFGAVVLVLFGLVPALLGRDRGRQRELVRASRSEVAQLEREQHFIEQQTRSRERARIAQDMHDSLGHELSLIALRVGALEVSPELDERHRGVFGELRSAVLASTERLAEIVGVLSEEAERVEDPADGDIRQLVGRVRDSGMRVRLRVTGEHHRPPVMVERATYRVLQEALTNAAKHAPGAPVTVSVEHFAAETVVTVWNATVAGAPPPRRSGQRGLIGLRERSRQLGGKLEAGERDGGYQVQARFPHGPDETP